MDKAVFDDDPKARLAGQGQGTHFFGLSASSHETETKLCYRYYGMKTHIDLVDFCAIYVSDVLLYLLILGQPMATVKCSFLIVTSEFR